MATARDVMSKVVRRIDREATVEQAVLKMNEHSISSLIVDKQSPGDTFGILSMRDVCYKVVARGLSVNNVRVHEIMTKPIIFCLPEMSVKHVARLFANNRVSRAPVVDSGEIIGVVAIKDLMTDLHLVNSMM